MVILGEAASMRLSGRHRTEVPPPHMTDAEAGCDCDCDAPSNRSYIASVGTALYIESTSANLEQGP
jgi:hypothetical protein